MHMYRKCTATYYFITCYCEIKVRSQVAGPDCAFIALISTNLGLQHNKKIVCFIFFTRMHQHQYVVACSGLCNNGELIDERQAQMSKSQSHR